MIARPVCANFGQRIAQLQHMFHEEPLIKITTIGKFNSYVRLELLLRITFERR